MSRFSILARRGRATFVGGGGVGPLPQAPIITSYSSPASGQARVTWEAPTLKVDESALSEGSIVRHWVYRAETEGAAGPGGAYAERIEVTMPTLTYLFTGLSGTDYFGVTCESDYGESDRAYEVAIAT